MKKDLGFQQRYNAWLNAVGEFATKIGTTTEQLILLIAGTDDKFNSLYWSEWSEFLRHHAIKKPAKKGKRK